MAVYVAQEPVREMLYAVNEVSKDFEGEVCYCELRGAAKGVHERGDNGKWIVFLDIDLSPRRAIDVLVHELAHCLSGSERHDAAWEKANADLRQAYAERVERLRWSTWRSPDSGAFHLPPEPKAKRAGR